MKIGLISDTHNFFDPKIPELFSGVEYILHGGDIGQLSIILELENIAPVTAVLGNNDTGLNFKETEIIDLADRKFLIHHIVDVRDPSEIVQQRIDFAKPDVVLFGHTHKPFNQILGQTLFLNPGYAGKPRFNLSRSVAILNCDKSKMTVEFKSL